MKLRYVLPGLFFLFVVAAVVYVSRSCTAEACNWWPHRRSAGQVQPVRSFEDCVAAGNAVMESYPRQCRAGKITFVESVQDQPSSGPVEVQSVQPNQVISSPLQVTGQALGSWFFEASFPVRLLDANGSIVITSFAQAQGEWMTADMVPFVSTVTFPAPPTPTGFLEFVKDNPSGLPENDASVRIPVRFR